MRQTDAYSAGAGTDSGAVLHLQWRFWQVAGLGEYRHFLYFCIACLPLRMAGFQAGHAAMQASMARLRRNLPDRCTVCGVHICAATDSAFSGSAYGNIRNLSFFRQPYSANNFGFLSKSRCFPAKTSAFCTHCDPCLSDYFSSNSLLICFSFCFISRKQTKQTTT